MLGIFLLLRALPALALLWVVAYHVFALGASDDMRDTFRAFKCANVTTAICGALWALTPLD